VTGRSAPYSVRWTAEAWAEVNSLKVFERRPVMRAVDELAYQAEVETRNRKLLREPIADLPDATWEVRIRSRHRLLYAVYRVTELETQQRTVEILRAIIKDTETTERAIRRER
jgi:Txe/YoeB family toxin of Txe-Axe toxin-antitoxin module